MAAVGAPKAKRESRKGNYLHPVPFQENSGEFIQPFILFSTINISPGCGQNKGHLGVSWQPKLVEICPETDRTSLETSLSVNDDQQSTMKHQQMEE